MENLLAKDPMINVVYTINEPAAAGAYEALKAIGREGDVLIVSVDGGCPASQNVKDGVIGATSQQYPLLMASLGIEAIAAWAKDGTKPEPPPKARTSSTPACAGHRQAGRRRRVDLGRRRHGQVLGLIPRPTGKH
jgi:ABC-type sugar transport system substrate-binding protein